MGATPVISGIKNESLKNKKPPFLSTTSIGNKSFHLHVRRLIFFRPRETCGFGISLSSAMGHAAIYKRRWVYVMMKNEEKERDAVLTTS
jgi:hypothetical protein